MTQVEQTSNHYEVLQRKVADKLCRDGIAPGGRLPSERELAEFFNVSYLTLRRAISEMVDRGILERRPRSGTYLRPEGYRRLNNQSVMLVVTGYDSELAKRFISLGIEEAQKRQWVPHVVHMDRIQERIVIQALNSGEPALLLSAPDAMTPELMVAVKQAQGRAVLIGNRMDAMGIPSVVADDAHGIRMAMEYLQQLGHKHIAIVGCEPNYSIDQLQLSTWEKCLNLPGVDLSQYILPVNSDRFSSPLDNAYQAMMQWLKHRPRCITAMLCVVDEMLPAVNRAVIDSGMSIPNDISLVGFGNTAVSRYANPSVTSIDPHLVEHVEKGMGLLQRALDDPASVNRNVLIQIEPELVQRESVCAAHV